jgi:hypothetical protein
VTVGVTVAKILDDVEEAVGTVLTERGQHEPFCSGCIVGRCEFATAST